MDPELMEQLKQRTAELPAVVRNAIATIDVQKQLRGVSDRHKLHLDQWSRLENEVLLTLLGFASPADLPLNIQKTVGVSEEDAQALAADINTIVFEPIREELERQLEHPDAKEKEVTPEDAARQAILASGGVAPATPPAPKPTEKAVRAPLSSTYTSREPSTNRSSVTGDPYRESPI